MGKKKDWREAVWSHGDGGSIYDADIYCDGCTNDIKERLDKEGKTPEDPDDDRTFDSGDYPKVSNLEHEESDSPQHCGSHEHCVNAIKLPCGSKIGAWLGGSLTGEGIESLADTIWNDLVSTSEHSRQVGRLWRQIYSDQLGEYKSVAKEASNHGMKVDRKSFHPLGYYVDLDAVYIVGEVTVRGDDTSQVDVLRYEASPTGTYPKEPEVVKTDTSRWEGHNPEEVLGEIISEEGWS